MMPPEVVNLVAVGILGLLSGILVSWLLCRPKIKSLQGQVTAAEQLRQEAEVARAKLEEKAQRLPELEQEIKSLKEERVELHALLAGREISLQAEADKNAWLEQAREVLRETFQALSSDILRANADEFLGRAQDSLAASLRTYKAELTHLVQPLDEALKGLDRHVRELEGKREGAYGELRSNLDQLQQVFQRLQAETARLNHALRAGAAQRGRWAEFQLQRLVEMAGLKQRVDFDVQVAAGERRLDLVVYLPRGGCVVVDAKAPMAHYLEALDLAQEEARHKKLLEHAKGVRQHVDNLSRREYWRHLPETAELVVMYLPSDACLTVALERDPEMLEHAFQRRIVLATPTTLFALLKTVAVGWQQHQIADNAQKIFDLGRDLHHRLVKFAEHLAGVGKGLEAAAARYNEAVGSFENRVLPAARRFQELELTSDALPEPKEVETSPRSLKLPIPET